MTMRSITITLILTIFLSFWAAATASPAICELSPHPRLCRSMVSGDSNYDLRSIQTALRITNLVQSRLPPGSRDSALEECRRGFDLNADILTSVAEDVAKMKNSTSTSSLVHRVRTRLSAVTANHRTCREGLVNEPEMEVVSRAGKVYSVTLGLVTHALSPESYGQQKSSSHHHHHHHHHHHSHSHKHPRPQPPPAPTQPPQQSPAPTQPPQQSPAPTPPPPSPTPNSNTGHRNQDGSARPCSLTDIIMGLKKSQSRDSSNTTKCELNTNGKLMLPGLKGHGILVSDGVIVSKDGSGDFLNIGDAVEFAPERLTPEEGYFVIYAKAGIYEDEYVTIPSHKQSILLLGDGMQSTIISGKHSNATGYCTACSASFRVEGDNFMAIDVTFRNTAGPKGNQAVALMSKADRSAFFRCSFEGYQDTLYVHSRTQFYRDCKVTGTVDFIFGDASAMFQNSYIIGRRGRSFTVAANNRGLADENTGLVFHNCTVNSEREDTHSGGFLGRPWREYARTVYMESSLGAAIEPRGWGKMNGNEARGNIYFAEFQNTGPGSATGSRVSWTGVHRKLTLSEALSFTVQNFTDAHSWLPFTDIPFTPGFL